MTARREKAHPSEVVKVSATQSSDSESKGHQKREETAASKAATHSGAIKTDSSNPHQSHADHADPKAAKPERIQLTPTSGPKFQQNVVGHNNTVIQAEQINIGAGSRLLPNDKYAQFVQGLRQLPKGTAALVVHLPATKEMDAFGGQLQSAFKEAGWDLPGFATDISNSHIMVSYGPNQVLRNTPDGLHCVIHESELSKQILQALQDAGINCILSPDALYPTPKPKPTITLFMGRSLD